MATIWPSIISTVNRSNSRARGRARCFAALQALICILTAGPALGCPFCTAQKPTLCQQQAAAAATVLAEVQSARAAGPVTVKLHRVFSGEEVLPAATQLTVPLDLAVSPGELLILFGSRTATGLEWHAVAVDEVSYAYFAQAPRGLTPLEQRLRYFATFLEHPNQVVAEDAYLEFAHAPFDLVAESAGLLPMQRIAAWLSDPNVPSHRKGFYGLALGLARDPQTRRANARVLRQLIVAPDDDFRAGFDGILGGYLLLQGVEGLDLLNARYFANPQAAVGDVRHAMTALRFYHEYGREIPPERLAAAVQHLLARPEFAEATITDLARWQAWKALADITALYGKPEYSQPAIRRAIVGYLLACPQPVSREALLQLREQDPRGVSEAEAVLSSTSSVPLQE